MTNSSRTMTGPPSEEITSVFAVHFVATTTDMTPSISHYLYTMADGSVIAVGRREFLVTTFTLPVLVFPRSEGCR